MGAQWKHAGRLDAAAKRGQLFGKIVKEIAVSAKMGGADPDLNARLRVAIEAARKQSVPRDTIERAVKKGAGLLDEQMHFETVVYEGFAPSKVPVIVECLTENKNRTASDIRVLFKKGHLGTMGSVAWMFDRAGIVEAHHADAKTDLDEAAIEAGADNVEAIESTDNPHGHLVARFTCAISAVDQVSKALTERKWVITAAELGYNAKNSVEVTETERKEVIEFLSDIDDHEDVHRVYTALT